MDFKRGDVVEVRMVGTVQNVTDQESSHPGIRISVDPDKPDRRKGRSRIRWFAVVPQSAVMLLGEEISDGE